jgi:two-component system chemotaxis response regulator CheB
MREVQPSTGCPIIALVSSAGGLEALTRVLRPLPAGFGAAVIALQHQQPDRHSELRGILDTRCALKVVAAERGMAIAPGRIYVAPPGKHVLVQRDETFALITSGGYPPHRPSADLLLVSLALIAGRRAIAVVLSGRGNDGATGATAVHDLGGLVVAADRASSEEFSMPEATIGRHDAVDHVMHVDKIGDLLQELVRRA